MGRSFTAPSFIHPYNKHVLSMCRAPDICQPLDTKVIEVTSLP